jgi:ABC-type Fe3+ transport system permease subunit
MSKIKKLISFLREAYHSPANIPRLVYQAFFTEVKKNSTRKTFTTKKFYAFVFSALAIYNNVTLSFFASNHWSVTLTSALKTTKLGDDAISTIIVTIVATVNGLALGALSIYGWSKRHGAA